LLFLDFSSIPYKPQDTHINPHPRKKNLASSPQPCVAVVTTVDIHQYTARVEEDGGDRMWPLCGSWLREQLGLAV